MFNARRKAMARKSSIVTPLTEALERSGLTVAELANKTGLARQQISDCIHYRYECSEELLRRITSILGIEEQTHTIYMELRKFRREQKLLKTIKKVREENVPSAYLYGVAGWFVRKTKRDEAEQVDPELRERLARELKKKVDFF
jgi:plasmid maintenance system antidote protein VapI